MGVVLKELRQQSTAGAFRLLVAVDGVNALWGRTTLAKEDRSPVGEPRPPPRVWVRSGRSGWAVVDPRSASLPRTVCVRVGSEHSFRRGRCQVPPPAGSEGGGQGGRSRCVSAACLSPERGSAPGDDQRPRGGGAWLGPLVEARGGRGWGRSWLGSGSMPAQAGAHIAARAFQLPSVPLSQKQSK